MTLRTNRCPSSQAAGSTTTTTAATSCAGTAPEDGMSQCNETFDKIAHQLGGFTCRNAPAIVHLRNPLSLTNWTLPVLELMMVFGAALALWWSIRRLRRDNDPTNLALWIASIVYLLATEIPAVLPGPVRHAGPHRGGLRPQRVHGSVPLRAASAVHRRAVSRRCHPRVRNRPRSRGFRPASRAPSRGPSASASCTSAATRSSISWGRSCGGGSGTPTTRSTIRCSRRFR